MPMTTRRTPTFRDRRTLRLLRLAAASATVAVEDESTVVRCAWCGRLVIERTTPIPHGFFTTTDNLDDSPHRCGPPDTGEAA